LAFGSFTFLFSLSLFVLSAFFEKKSLAETAGFLIGPARQKWKEFEVFYPLLVAHSLSPRL
jgi:hypothetical protein